MNTLTLPWPDKNLNPNAKRRNHWSVTSKATKLAREIAYLFSKTGNIPTAPNAKKITLHCIHYQPDYRKRDDDNMKGSLKAYFDGLAQWMGVDDNIVKATHEFPEERISGGKILFQITIE